VREVRVNRVMTAKPGASSGVWRKVTRDGTTGWMHSAYISPGLTSLGTRYVEVNGLRLRSKPSTSGKVLDTLSKGKAVKKIWPKSGGWVKVYVNGKQVGTGTTTVKVKRGEDYAVMAKLGDRVASGRVGRKISGTGVADIVGGFLLLVPFLGVFGPIALAQSVDLRLTAVDLELLVA
jgi:uncharacterized protein YgiM (DUF1202 family)